MQKLLKIIKDRRGAGMTEYIILVGVIALLSIAAFRFFGKSVSGIVDKQAKTVDGIETGTP
jgi:Flp pilus assembly pilin Flp